jgi:hypothetical protein
MTRARGLPRLVRALLVACTLTVAIDALAFRTSLYRRIVEPESHAGLTERILRRARRLPADAENVLVLGDSRVGEGFSEAAANEFTPGTGVRFLNGAAGGSTPRCWYYMVREMDPGASRFRAVVIPADAYEDADGASDWADNALDSRIVAFCLRASDAWDFAASFHDPRARVEALRGALLKGFLLKNDVQSLLAHPTERLRKVRAYEEHDEEWSRAYQGNAGTVNPDEARAALNRPTAPQTGDYARYRKLWYGRIIGHYQGKPTHIIFCRIPAHPLRELHPLRQSSRVILSLASPQVTVLDESEFADLERPELFFDPDHMNSEGRKRFTPRLAAKVIDALSHR